MRLSKAGLVAVALYAVPALGLAAFALSSGDFKGQFVLMQLALLPAVLLVGATGLTGFFIAHPCLNSYGVSAALSVLIVYGLGALLGRIFGRKAPPSTDR